MTIKNIQQAIFIPLKDRVKDVKGNTLAKVIIQTDKGFQDGGCSYSFEIKNFKDKKYHVTVPLEHLGDDITLYKFNGLFDYNPDKKMFIRNKTK
jgi:hypothetical protein